MEVNSFIIYLLIFAKTTGRYLQAVEYTRADRIVRITRVRSMPVQRKNDVKNM